MDDEMRFIDWGGAAPNLNKFGGQGNTCSGGVEPKTPETLGEVQDISNKRHLDGKTLDEKEPRWLECIAWSAHWSSPCRPRNPQSHPQAAWFRDAFLAPQFHNAFLTAHSLLRALSAATGSRTRVLGANHMRE